MRGVSFGLMANFYRTYLYNHTAPRRKSLTRDAYNANNAFVLRGVHFCFFIFFIWRKKGEIFQAGNTGNFGDNLVLVCIGSELPTARYYSAIISI